MHDRTGEPTDRRAAAREQRDVGEVRTRRRALKYKPAGDAIRTTNPIATARSRPGACTSARRSPGSRYRRIASKVTVPIRYCRQSL